MADNVTENVDLENIIIDPSTDGSIVITAEITDASPPELEYKRSKAMSLAFSPSVSNTDGIEISGGGTYEYVINSSTLKDNGSGDACTECTEIPAFFSHGSVVVEYNMMDTDDPDSKVDLICDLFIEFPTKPNWYPYSLVNFTNDEGNLSMAQAMQGLVTATNRSTKREVIADGTSLQSLFTINSWPGIMPIVVKEIQTRDANGKTLPMIKRGCLPPAQFKIRIKNNTGYINRLSALTVKILINYYEDDWLMDMTNTSKQNVVKLYPSPKFLAESDPKHLWAICDGYQMHAAGLVDEIVKVYAYYNKTTDVDKFIQEMTCLTMDPITETGGTNYLPFVYKTRNTDLINATDHARQNTKGFESNEKAWVVTPADVCHGTKFKEVGVYTSKDEDGLILTPNDKDVEFTILTTLRTDIEEEMTEEEFYACFSKIRYYDVIIPFNKEATIKRSDIDNIFYETLSDTFESAVVFESARKDIPPFCRLKINDKTDWLPLYADGSLRFCESLSKCNDGIRSQELFYYSQSQQPVPTGDSVEPVEKQPKKNKITLKPTKKRYDVGIVISYGKFKGVHIHEFTEEKKEGT